MTIVTMLEWKWDGIRDGILWTPKWGLFIGFSKARGEVAGINGQD